jgi:hypothetical protein
MRLTQMAAVAVATVALGAAPASAKTITLHYFFTQASVRLTDAAGHTLNPKQRAAAGDKGDQVGLAYRGSHKHHAKRWTASFHLRCVFKSSKRATCDAQIAVGGSMLLANGAHLNFRGKVDKVTINGGTGVFRRARGTLTSISVANTNNSDITIRVRT